MTPESINPISAMTAGRFSVSVASVNLINETRLAYRRFSQPITIPSGLSFPGLDQFPNIGLKDLGLDIGPNPNAPQTYVENNYQVVNNLTWLRGNHSLKFGGDFRRVISPQSFVPRQRGDYQYNTFDLFLRDISPDFLAERTVGASPYYGDQHLLYAFAQDDWRVRNNLTLNLGVNYSYQEVPKGANLQALNSIASVPGLIEFNVPKEQLWNFAPKAGLVWSPSFDTGMLGRVFGSQGKSSLRAGFSMAYDYIFDNLYILALPPQSNQTNSVEPDEALPGFLASGAIPPTPVDVGNDPAAARANTASFIPDQEVPYSLTWTLSFQRQFLKDWSFEARARHPPADAEPAQQPAEGVARHRRPADLPPEPVAGAARRAHQAGLGAIANSARNTLQLPGINNFDISVFKNFNLGGEGRRRIQLRADFFNAFNHPQYIPGSPNDVAPIDTVGVGQVNTVFAGNTDFNRPERVFSSNPRVIQLALRFDF